jgi:hypothetical protein
MKVVLQKIQIQFVNKLGESPTRELKMKLPIKDISVYVGTIGYQLKYQ